MKKTGVLFGTGVDTLSDMNRACDGNGTKQTDEE